MGGMMRLTPFAGKRLAVEVNLDEMIDARYDPLQPGFQDGMNPPKPEHDESVRLRNDSNAL